MATYKEIQTYVKKQFGFVPKTCWIAHVKYLSGLPMQKAPNRQGEDRLESCPDDRIEAIRAALRHFGIIG